MLDCAVVIAYVCENFEGIERCFYKDSRVKSKQHQTNLGIMRSHLNEF